jgi:predicted N-acetyltransferase YhbS
MGVVSIKGGPVSRMAGVSRQPALKLAERQRIQVKPVIPGDLEDRQNLLRRAFSRAGGDLYKRRNFFRDYVTHDPHFKRPCLLGLYRNGRLVSTCQVFRRIMAIGARKFALEGLGNIATDPAYQRQGFGSMLLRWFIDHPTGRRDLSILYTGLPGFYTRLGWQQKTYRSLSVFRTAAWQPPALPGTRMRSMRAADRGAIANIYSRFNRTYGIPHLLRSKRYWRNWVLAWKLKVYGLTTEVIVDRDKVIGYVFASVTSNRMTVEEYGALPGKMEQVAAAVISRFYRSNGVSELLLLCATAPLEQAMKSLEIPYEMLRMSHGPGHAYLFNRSLEPWRDKICLWHVDHF